MSAPLPRAKPTCQWVNVAKGLGILLVVAGHFSAPGIEPGWWQPVRHLIYSFHMPLFFLLSGYLFALYGRTPATAREYGTLVGKKVERLLYPYIILTAAFAVLKSAGQAFFVLDYPVGPESWRHVLLNPTGGFAELLWFIYALFVIFLIHPLLARVLRRDGLVLGAAVGLSCLPWPQAFCLSQAFSHMPFFALGAFMARRPALLPTRVGDAAAAAAVCAVVFVLAAAEWLTVNLLPGMVRHTILSVSGVLACLTLSKAIERSAGARTLSVLGAYSGAIYLMHTLVMAPGRLVCLQVLGLTDAYFLPVAVTVCAVGVMGPVLIERHVLSRNASLARAVLGRAAQADPADREPSRRPERVIRHLAPVETPSLSNMPIT